MQQPEAPGVRVLYGTVVTPSPLTVRIDGDTDAVSAVSCVGAVAGQRVVMLLQSRVLTVLGVVGGGGPPAGAVQHFATATAPAGWLVCDGSAVSRTTYAALFAAIGATFGAGDGAATFNLPNLKGRTIVGRDSGQTEFDALGETGGEKTHVLTIAEMPAHDHTYTKNMDTAIGAAGSGAWRASTSTNTGSTGGGTAHNNLQPYMALTVCIKT
jgi:microcystin-dependent protein